MGVSTHRKDLPSCSRHQFDINQGDTWMLIKRYHLNMVCVRGQTGDGVLLFANITGRVGGMCILSVASAAGLLYARVL